MLPAPAIPDKALFRDTPCGHFVGVLLLCYGLFNTYLFVKFTPVYVATQCGDQTADLQDLSLGQSIKVALQIQVSCWNPNAYGVAIKTSVPGYVYLGSNREYQVGRLTLVEGSELPAQGSGDIRVKMDAELSQDTSEKLIPLFLRGGEIPMFLELQFEVSVNINFGLLSFGTTAPFQKKCGMNLGSLLVNSGSRLGPMICRSSFFELDGQVPHAGVAQSGAMSFSGAQMDPDRIAMGETAKNISIISVGLVCYVFGFLLVYHWIKKACRPAPPKVVEPPASARYMIAGQPSCFRAQSGNFQDLPPAAAKGGGAFGPAADYLLGRTRGQVVEPESGEEQRGGERLSTLLRFITCGAAGKRMPQPARAPAPQPMYFQRQCMRGQSGNLAELE